MSGESGGTVAVLDVQAGAWFVTRFLAFVEAIEEGEIVASAFFGHVAKGHGTTGSNVKLASGSEAAFVGTGLAARYDFGNHGFQIR